MQMSEAKMKGSNRYMETAEEDRKGRDESKGQNKGRRTFFFKKLRKRSCLVGVSQQFEERISIKNEEFDGL